MTETFYDETLRLLMTERWLRADDDVLVVAGGTSDREALLLTGIRSATITNVDDRVPNGEYAPYVWSRQDAEALTFPDASFDVSIVHQGLHHCRSPHRALLEMYRVARRGVVVFEPHDTMLTRIGVRVGVGQQYEVAAVAANDLQRGGVQNTELPNYVYRWTAREARKALASYDPSGVPQVRCLYDLRVPGQLADRMRARPARLAARMAVPVARALLRVLPAQGNAIALVIDKVDASRLQPWLRSSANGPELDPTWFGPHVGVPEHGE